MPNYQVTLFFDAMAEYEVEAADDDAAIREAHRLNDLGTEADFNERLSLYYTGADVYEDEEDTSC